MRLSVRAHTKKHVYLIADKNYPSTFACEIEGGDYGVVIEEPRIPKGESDTPFTDWVRSRKSS